MFQFLLRPRTSKHWVVYHHHRLRNHVFMRISVLLSRFASPKRGFAQTNIYVNNNNTYLLQLSCHPVAVVILHVYKI